MERISILQNGTFLLLGWVIFVIVCERDFLSSILLLPVLLV